MAEPKTKPSVYVETTIPSYLAAWPSRDLLLATQQQLTQEWWRAASETYELVVSQSVIEEASRGDTSAAAQRIELLKMLQVLPDDPAVPPLATEYVSVLTLPDKARADAIHLATAVVFELDYLVTWNMRHLANSLTMRRLTEYNSQHALWIPLIVTPQYLLESQQQEET